ncbi:hypothetical protein ACS5PU_12760 [Pedobacter sp. GSP4]|uniref:hypothetical protein n=1 Tax=Pedobacter sp. GSP4 TaxID=3453716 RepID=UPI003EE93983
MKKVLSFCILICSLFFFGAVKAQTGCVVGGTYIYNVPDGTFSGVPAYRVNDPITSYGVLTASYCVSYGAANSCYVNSYTTNYSSSYGTSVTYSGLPCPIDDYIPLMLIAAGIIGFYQINRKLRFSHS